MQTKGNTNDFAVGMSNVPSDALCPDNAAAIEYNLIFRNGEHLPIQQPVYPHAGYVGDELENVHCLYIHSYNKYKRYIGVQEDGVNSRLVWHDYDDVENTSTQLITGFDVKVSEIKGITSIGNTLIVSLSTQNHESLHYFLWKPENKRYTFLGTKLPNPSMDFFLTNKGGGMVSYNVTEQQPYGNMITPKDTGDGTYTFTYESEKEEDAKALLVGLYSKCKNKALEKCSFCQPFFVRYALKLYDGSYTNISTPILMFGSVRRSVGFSIVNNEILAKISPSFMYFIQSKDLRNWSDIIKGVSVFISKPVEVHLTDRINVDNRKIDRVTGSRGIDNHWNVSTEGNNSMNYNYGIDFNCSKCFDYLDDTQIANELLQSMSVFYKIFDIDNKPTNGYEAINKYIRPNDLKNLTTLEQLDHDDYYAQCNLMPNSLFMYNKRLHLSNVKRGYYQGSSVFTHITMSGSRNIVTYVYIHTQDGDRIIKNSFMSNDSLGFYFYYPDSRAYKVTVFIDSTTGTTIELKSHPFLNGAYFISDSLPGENSSSDNFLYEQISAPKENTEPEQLQNEVWVSEVNNPFVFNASGVNTVGNGEILGIISNTTALSQGQFGQFPLYCFTTDGIYALETSSTGIYSSAHPLSREILDCTKSITATDSMIFFTSKKGLMALAGSEVKCVSEHLLGKTYKPTESEIEILNTTNIEPDVSFLDFLKDCFMAYDYRDKLLWIMNEDYYQIYVFSIESGAFSLTSLDEKPINVINDYPDNIIQTKNNIIQTKDNEYHLYSLINRPNINGDDRTINAFIIGRPMKIGDSLTLKTPIEIKPIMDMDARKMKLRLFGLYNNFWSKILSVRGMGFKAFKYNLIFENLFPNETFSGIMEKWQMKFQGRFR